MSKLASMNYLWVVEIFEKRRWESTVGASLSRADGRIKLTSWKRNNPVDRFRLVRYVRERK